MATVAAPRSGRDRIHAILHVVHVVGLVAGAVCVALAVAGVVLMFRPPMFAAWCVSYLACFVSTLAALVLATTARGRQAQPPPRVWPYYFLIIALLLWLVLVGAAVTITGLSFL